MSKAATAEKPAHVIEEVTPRAPVSKRSHIVIFKNGDGWQAIEGSGGNWEKPLDPPMSLAVVVDHFMPRTKTCDLTITVGHLDLSEIEENVFPMRDMEVCLRKPGDPHLWQNYCWDSHRQRASCTDTFAKLSDRLAEIVPTMAHGKGWLIDFWIRHDLTAHELFPRKA